MKEENGSVQKLTVLQFLCIQLGWQGGTIHQALQAVSDISESNNTYPNKAFIVFSFVAMEKSNLIDQQSAGYEKLKELLR